jgi:SAM-dependent methyltransferase
VAHAASKTDDRRAGFAVGDAEALPVPDSAFDAAVSGLVLNFIPDPTRAMVEACRVVRAGGTIGAYVWDYAGEMQLIRVFWNAATRLDATAAPLDEGRRFQICRPDALRALYEGAGLHGVEVEAIDVPTHFASFDDYWQPFLGGQGPAPAYAMSLPPEHRTALRESIRSSLPIRADGTIDLVARAWAVKGSTPV